MLPYFCTVTMTFSIGMPACFATLSMIRRLAWWGITRPTSSAGTPCSASTRVEASAIAFTARLKITCPSKSQIVSPKVTSRPAYPQPNPRTRSACRASASHPSTLPTIPSSLSDACSTTAAAPSPKSTATLRLLQSMYRLISSTPMTTAFRIMPVRIIAVAVASP